MENSRRTANVVCESCLMDLPTALLLVILFKLPITCIMNLKLVCKSLYKLVSDPEFSINYSKDSFFESFFLLPKTNMSLVLLEISENSEFIETTFKPKIPSCPKERSFFIPQGTCNGFLCLSVYQSRAETVYICNPIMGECFKLPTHRMLEGRDSSVEYGFGFCRATNNYKVFRFFCKRGMVPAKGQCKIFTVGVDDRWRVLPNTFDAGAYSNTKMVNINGVFHWLVMYNRITSIFTFDIEDEKFGQVSPPNGLVLSKDSMNLISIHDQLCLVDNSDRSVINIWKMKEYGVAESWTKDVTFNVPSPLGYPMVTRVTISKNGDILFSFPFQKHTIRYNPVKRTFNEIQVSFRESSAYAPSFVTQGSYDGTGFEYPMNVLSK